MNPENIPSELQNIKEKIIDMNKQMPYLIDEYKTNFVFSQMTPDDHEYQIKLNNSKNDIQNINSNIFSLSNQVDTTAQKFEDNLEDINFKIDELKNKNIALKDKISNLNEQYNGSDEMIDEYKYLYNYYFLRNILFFLGSIGSLVAMNNIFKS
jgi:predicted  nucleic acid-binding Zn-ribbon protein